MKICVAALVCGLAIVAAQTTNNRNTDDGGYSRYQYGPPGFGSSGTGYTAQGIPPDPYHGNHFTRVRYYKAPNGRVYAETPNGTLVDVKTGYRFPAGRGGARIIPAGNNYERNYHVYPDGSTYAEIDGRLHKIEKKDSNGRTYYTDSNGETHYRVGDRNYYRQRDGTVYWRGPDGVKHFRNTNDNSEYTEDRFGNRYITRPDGSKWIASINNCNYRVQGDGTTTRTTNDSYCPDRFSGTSPTGAKYGSHRTTTP
ncbi:hypothetical protein LOTGIDRAFT_156107 [Lottia gigantea]|uniref:Uncharacterized protein n=1 Tax=Lottia gigantea TaxID=225164 RepID=V4BBF4_LOTGI|nr:hypothetical protein LOTGIDRAFT_156107 [Lottia gigantea]ESP04866.1 hypothetical protein LOTGIDRAFT_156107 [Lottia gigantea]